MLKFAVLIFPTLLLCGCDAGYLHGKRCDAEKRCLEGYVCEPVSGRCLWPWEIPDGGTDGSDTGCSSTPGSQYIYTNVTLDGKESPVEVDPGVALEIRVVYALNQIVGCNNCPNQFLFGLKSAAYGHQPLLCNQTGIPPPCPAVLNGNVIFSLPAPYIPDTYQLMSTVSQDVDCDRAMANYFNWISRRAAQAASIIVREPDCPDSYAYLSRVKLNNQPPPLNIAAGQKVGFEADYTASRVQTCIDCPAQLVVGVEEKPVICKELGKLPACPASQKGTINGDFLAPTQASSYLIKIGLFTAADCHNAQNLYQTNPPGRGWTVAVINVQ